MSVNVMNGLHEKCQSVNQASFLECGPTEVFLHDCHTRVSVPQSWLTYRAPLFWTASSVLIRVS